jgi:hypothetical protein
MLDFSKLSRNLYENATPEQRAQMDAAHAKREADAARTRSIPAVFVRTAYKGRPENRRIVEISREFKEIGLRIDDMPSTFGSEPRVLKFLGGPTGHEAYRLDPDFIAELMRDDAGDELCICAGTPGSCAQCSVKRSDVVAFLREMAPDLTA